MITVMYKLITNYPELMITIDSEAPTIGTVQTQINMELEPRMNEEYFVQYIYVQ